MSSISFELYVSAFGHGAVVASDAGVAGVILPFGLDSEMSAVERVLMEYPGAVRGKGCSGIAADELCRYFSGELTSFTVPLDFGPLTPFQLEVSKSVIAIPYGQVRSYGEVARSAGSPGAARGVGGVMAANRLPILVPCHRVVAADGGLCGYSGYGGKESKNILLQMEGVRFYSSNRVILR